MYKKIAIALSVLLLIGLMVGCVPRQTTRSDETPVRIPDQLIPSDVDKIPAYSFAYYEKDITLEEVQSFYKAAFNEIGAEVLKEYNKEELVEMEIVPLPEQEEGQPENTGTIVWACMAKQGGTTIFVTSALDGNTSGVAVAVGARAENMAEAYKMIVATGSTDATSDTVTSDSK